MSIEGEHLLLQIDALLSRLTDADPSGDTEYSFENLLEGDITRNKVIAVISILVKGNTSIEPKLRELLSKSDIRDSILNIHGSDKSIIQDIEDTFVQIISGKKPIVQKHPKPAKEKKKPVRSLKGAFFSLVNLKRLLNEKLHDTLKDNMGKGNSKNLLNYRTGRFAKTVLVTKLANTREGKIEAFYTYMKYPYQTFEPGFKQGDPDSRDPKLLIAKSIRQIASKIVANRLKAILV